MKTQALKGMRDLLPNEQTLRDYIQGKILETYRASGFERISTPMLEDMENLDKSDGGDNLNLIFKVLKRGDKLTAALNSGDPKELSDMGLRYDLTLPLSRFYAANKDKLPHPFKVIQTDRVFRAERPQKGRLREFVQCDIDILGDASDSDAAPRMEGRGLLPTRAEYHMMQRHNSYYVGKFGEMDIVVFKSLFGHTYPDDELANPLFRVERGVGRHPGAFAEGILRGGLMANNLIGPLQTLNPTINP